VAQRPEAVPVPGAPEWLLGLMLHEEEVLPLVDLARALQLESSPVTASRMFVHRGAGFGVGFAVDDVDEDRGGAELRDVDLTALARSLLVADPP
jgi:chemotaxis signal transduction protein